MNSGFFIAFSSSKCIGLVSGAKFCLTFLRFWRVDEDDTPSQKNPTYRPSTAELSVKTIRNLTMTYILPLECIGSLLRNCGCVTIKLRGVEAVATVHMERKLEHCDPRDSGRADNRLISNPFRILTFGMRSEMVSVRSL